MRPMPRLVAASSIAALLLAAQGASAQSIIRNPGNHPGPWELEPHGLLRPYVPSSFPGLGVGFRATRQIGENNFVSSINNSAGITFGLDWMFFETCSRCSTLHLFAFPVALQWSFYLSKSWSVFAEPGATFYAWSQTCNGFGCADGRFVDLALFLGGRWHFSDAASLTMRVGWPYFSVGVSFFP